MTETIEDIYPLTPLQRGMLFESLNGSTTYNETISLRYERAIDVEAVSDAWEELVQRHAALRTSFEWRGLQEPCQVVSSRVDRVVEHLDWSQLDSGAQAAKLEDLHRQRGATRFNLDRGPLVRVTLITLAPESFEMVLSFHHTILDGWSGGLLLQQLWERYESIVSSSEPAPTRLPPKFCDYLDWLQRQDQSAAKDFWTSELRDLDGPTLTPYWSCTDDSGPGDEVVALSERESERIIRWAQQERVTLNSLICGSWAVLLSRYSGQQRVVFGRVTSGRDASVAGIEEMVGLFINTVPQAVDVDPSAVAAEWIHSLQARIIGAADYEHASLAEIQGWCEARNSDRLFDSVLVFENYPSASWNSRDGSPTPTPASAKYPIHITSGVSSGQLYIRTRLQGGGSESAGLLAAQLANLVRDLVDNPISALGGFRLRTPSDGRLPNPTAGLGAVDAPDVLDRLAGWCRDTPDAIAFLDRDEWSYGRLEELIDEAGTVLRAAGVQPGDVAAVWGSSRNLLVSAVALMRLGAVFAPQSRMSGEHSLPARWQIETTSGEFIDARPTAWAIRVNEQSYPPLAEPAAYVFPTSGTVGSRRHVVGSRRSLSDFIAWEVEEFRIGPGDRVAQLTDAGFDPLLRDLFAPIFAGAAVCAPSARLAPAEVLRWIHEHRITVLHCVPSLAYEWASHDGSGLSLDRLRVIAFAGEQLTRPIAEMWRALAPSAQLFNLYGPTETTLATACSQVDDGSGDIPVGRPIRGSQLLLFNNGRQCGFGEPGDVWIRTRRPTVGYLDTDGTCRSVAQSPPFDGRRTDAAWFRPGDRGYFTLSGALQLTGRDDHVVKLRGRKFDIGDAEKKLARLLGIGPIHILADDSDDADADARLVVFALIDRTRGRTQPELNRLARQALGLSTPTLRFLSVGAFPTTANGKVDRRRLGRVAADHYAQVSSGHPDTRNLRSVALTLTATGEVLRTIWEDVLGHTGIEPWQSFFDLGGTSLTAMTVVSRVEQELGKRLEVDELWEFDTLHRLEARLELIGVLSDIAAESDYCVDFGPRDTRAVLACIHPQGGGVGRYAPLAKHLRGIARIVAFRAPGVTAGDPAVCADFNALAGLYRSALAGVAADPDIVGVMGWSLGGPLAVQLAHELAEAGADVPQLFLFEPNPPTRPSASKLALVAAAEAIVEALLMSAPGPGQDSLLADLRVHLAELGVPISVADDPSEASRMLRVARRLSEGLASFELKPYFGSTVLVLTDELIRLGSDSPDLRSYVEYWTSLCPNTTVTHVPGTHARLFSGSYASSTAASIASFLNPLVSARNSRH